MIIMLHIRFPYLNAYYEVPDEEMSTVLSIQCSPKCGSLEEELQWMAYGCAVSANDARSVVRLVDHLGEMTTLGRRLPEKDSTGPGHNLPNGELVMKFCT